MLLDLALASPQAIQERKLIVFLERLPRNLS
jgi:hypothetical protein